MLFERQRRANTVKPANTDMAENAVMPANTMFLTSCETEIHILWRVATLHRKQYTSLSRVTSYVLSELSRFLFIVLDNAEP